MKIRTSSNFTGVKTRMHLIMQLNRITLQGRNQKFFGAGGGFFNKRFMYIIQKGQRRGKCWCLFSKILLKLLFK